MAEKNMKKVYVVTAGSYSDYRIVAIFSTPKASEEFKRAVPDGEYNDTEEFELDPPVVSLLERGYSIWRVHMLIDGNTELVRREETDISNIDTKGHWIWRRTLAPIYFGKGIPDILIAMVWAKTEKQAVKITNERRVQMIASGEWTATP